MLALGAGAVNLDFYWMPCIDSAHCKRCTQKASEPCAAASCGRRGQAVIWKALQKPADGNAAFQPRQAHARALVNAQTKSQVAVVGAFKPQDIWLLERCGVTVGGANTQRQQAACSNVNPTNL